MSILIQAEEKNLFLTALHICYLHIGTQEYLLAGVNISVICHNFWKVVYKVNL